MLPDVGLGEMLVIAVVAIIVVGPRGLPQMSRAIGRITGQARAMAREFRDAFDEMGREAELDELRKEMEALRQSNPLRDIEREARAAEAEARSALAKVDADAVAAQQQNAQASSQPSPEASPDVAIDAKATPVPLSVPPTVPVGPAGRDGA